MLQGTVLDPERQAATPPQPGFIRCPVLHLERHLGDMVTAVGIVFVRHWAARGRKEVSILPCPRPSECTNAPRSSSLVENLNSRLRNYFTLRRHLGGSYLGLLRFFLNHRRFVRSRHAERQGKRPRELMTGQGHPHWLTLLGLGPLQPQQA